ncbi:MAG: hypothetical protein CVV24_05055 [Ignavibacteriae bacterium HGW-Ignavibacteriae-3]|nr:MAG: hypothetical protein CVV24_05055 [Ignavibacteriae bacterium HGW-Ignavibacteriae-3]
MKLLIVDDSELIRLKIKNLLSNNSQIEIIGEAKDGIEALKLVEKYDPELMILDLKMPGMNGFELMKKLKKEGSQTKICVFTNHSFPWYKEKSLAEGADQFLNKSDDFEKLNSVIDEMVINVKRENEYKAQQFLKILSIAKSEPDSIALNNHLSRVSFKFELTIGNDLRSSVEKLKSEKYDVVLLDLNINNDIKYQSFDQIYAHCADIPIIVLSGKNNDELALRLIQEGAQDYLFKDRINSYILEKSILYSIEKHHLRREIKNELHNRLSADENLQKYYASLEAVMNNSHSVIIFLVDKDYRYLAFNNNHKAEMKKVYDADIEIGMNLLDLIASPEVKVKAKASIDRVLEDGSFVETQIQPGLNIHYEFHWNEVRRAGTIIGASCFVIDVTEREIAKEKIRQSALKYKNLFDDALTGNYISSVEGKLLLVNESFVKLFGFNSTEELIGKNLVDFYRYPDSREELLALIRKEKKLKNFEKEFVSRDGRVISVVENVVGEFNESGELVNIKGYINDITEKKIAEQRQIFSTKVLAILNRQNDWQKLIKDILTEFRSFTKIEAIGIRLKDGLDYPYYVQDGFDATFIESEDFLCAKKMNGSLDLDQNGFPLLECVCGAVISGNTDIDEPWFTKRGSFWVNKLTDLMNSKGNGLPGNNPRNNCVKSGYMSVALIPLRSGEDIIGLMQLSDKNVGRFDLDMIHYFEEIGATIGIAFNRMLAEKKIKESEENYRKFFDEDLTGDYKTTPEGKIILCNKAFANIMGFESVEQITNMSAQDFYINETDRAEFLKLLNEKGKLELYESTLRGKDGRIIHVIENVVGKYDLKGELLEITGYLFDITARKKAEEVIVKSEQKYRNIFESIQDVYYETDLAGIILEVSPSIELFADKNFKRNELLGKSIYDYYLNPNDRYELIKRLKKDQSVTDYEIVLKKSGASPLVCSISSRLEINSDGTPGKIIGTMRDITERKKMGASYIKLSRAVEQSPASVIITDVEGVIEYINPKLTEITGYKIDEVIGLTPRIFNSGEAEKSKYKDLWDTITRGEEWRGELHNKKKNGELYWELVSISPITDEKGFVTNYVAVKEDITERKKILEDLTIAKEKAEESNKLKTEFLAQMSHEMRSPMNAVLSFADIIKEEMNEKVTPELLTYFEGIHTAGRRLIRTVDLMINYSELQVGTYEKKIAKIDLLSEIVENVKNDYVNPIKAKGLQLSYITDLQEAWILGDKYSINQIIENLLGNAVKYTEHGQISVIIEKNISSRKFIVIIEDTGVGISEEYLTHLYQPFMQEERGYSRRFEGNGLGLSLVKKYCDLNSIKIDVVSDKKTGTRFTLTFDSLD